ncbi:MAG TPA: M2 family metallopeptidase [Polyangia bacterium]|jgi:peptidyl-dipeptidase A
MRQFLRSRTLLELASLAIVLGGAPADSMAAPDVTAAPVVAPPSGSPRPARVPPRRLSAAEKEARAFLDVVVPLILPVEAVGGELDWVAATDVTPEHTGARAGADKALAALSGSKTIIEHSKALLRREKELEPTTARQLHRLLLAAAEAPGTIPDVVAQRVDAESHQAAIQDGFTFCLQPKPGGGCLRPASANDLDSVLLKSRDLNERLRVWSASKEIGRPLKPGLVELQKLRNQVAREMGYSSFFGLQVADYGMSVKEMMDLLDATLETTRPLYEALHCFAKYTLAKRFARPVPKGLPAHWVGNRWAQRWPGLVDEANLDAYFKGAKPETIVKSAESFYTSLGFSPLPDSFWKRSDLYPVAATSTRKKNAHASAWHIDHDQDVRSLMSVEPDEQWFGTAHHELGHIYYFLAYSRPEVPPLLREGANRAFHEAVGELARLASEETPYLHQIGVLPASVNPDPMGWLLQSALDSIVFIPFSAGTMSHFERDLYEDDLPASEWQSRWWQYAARFQGVVAPNARPDDFCDACTKTHINDDPAQYYDYTLASLIKFQLHDHICTQILKQDVRSCNYAGQKAVGDFLRGILSLGATRDWRTVIKDATGEEISPRAMMAFYQPLIEEMAKRNAGRTCGFTE